MKTTKKMRFKRITVKKRKYKINGGSFKNKKKVYYNRSLKLPKKKSLRCSPKEKGKINEFSCYTDKSLYKLRDLWNVRHPDVIINTNNPQEIHSLLTKYLSSVCNKESCWLKQQFASERASELLGDSFAPESPDDWKKNPNEWLSSLEINSVMKQYEKAYKCYEFIGPTPIDFDKKKLYGECVWEELCHLNLEQLIKEGKTKIGIIFNTDPHNEPGQHWISMFINIKTGTIFFFDSVGDKAPKEIMKLVKRIKKQGLALKQQIIFKFDQNYPVEHQYGDTECGIYSIFFIVHLLEDKLSGHYFKTHILKDEYMENFRKIYFNEDL